jgi:hypothetical protein
MYRYSHMCVILEPNRIEIAPDMDSMAEEKLLRFLTQKLTEEQVNKFSVAERKFLLDKAFDDVDALKGATLDQLEEPPGDENAESGFFRIPQCQNPCQNPCQIPQVVEAACVSGWPTYCWAHLALVRTEWMACQLRKTFHLSAPWPRFPISTLPAFAWNPWMRLRAAFDLSFRD